MTASLVNSHATLQVKPSQVGEALAVGTSLVVGQYRVDLTTGAWWWSDEVYAMHGWTPGDVEPGLEALRSRKHPDDRSKLLRAVTEAMRFGRPFSCGHRIVDGHGRARTVIITGQGRRDVSGKVVEIAGYIVDATPVRREILEREASRAVARAFVSAAVVEQAKGVLMATHGVDEAAAARMLASRASGSGITVQEAAGQLMAALAPTGALGEVAKAAADAALGELHEVVRPRSRSAQLARRSEPVAY